MNVIALLAAFATILSAGFGALLLLMPDSRRGNFAEQFALSWLCGTGIVSLFLWTFGFFVRGALLAGFIAIVCIALPLTAWKLTGQSAIHFQSVRWLRPIEFLLAALLALEIALIFYLAYVHTLGWDGLWNWEIKARYAYSNGGVLPVAYFQSEGRSFSHPAYPLAIPFTELWLYLWLGEANQFWAKTIFPMFYAAGAILLAALSARLTGRTWIGLIAASLLFFVPQIATEGGSAIVGYADFPLSVFYLATIGYLLCACRSDDEHSFRIYAVCLALLPWVKLEGMILWFIAALCGALVIWRKKKSPVHLFALLPGLFVIIAWHLYLSQMHVVSSSDFLPVSFATFQANIHRLGPILSAFFSEVADTKTWSLFWLLVAIGSGYFMRRYRDARSLVFFIAVLGPIGIYAFIYIFSNWPDYLKHVDLSVSRLLMHVAPLSCLTVSVALAARWPQPARSPHLNLATCESADRERTPDVEFARTKRA